MDRKEFITKAGSVVLVTAGSAALLEIIGCKKKKEEPADLIPNVPVNFTIDLNDPLYVDLATDGGHVFISNEGVRGISVYRVSSSEYIALDRNCSHQPSQSCATVDVNSSNLLHCPCHGSQFQFDGNVAKGPATKSLKKYTTSLNGNFLTITN